ncbi:MAG: hypothetical protein DRN53_05935 [Thermoprotei archaeon]|nr:MAG: hypothetical protein DRN53_05935 [Thermoprotei archaeon]
MNSLKHEIILTKRAGRELKNISRDSQLVKRIEERLIMLGKGIAKGKRLKGKYKNLSSSRVGRYRIIYEDRQCKITVISVKHRRSTYARL